MSQSWAQLPQTLWHNDGLLQSLRSCPSDCPITSGSQYCCVCHENRPKLIFWHDSAENINIFREKRSISGKESKSMLFRKWFKRDPFRNYYALKEIIRNDFDYDFYRNEYKDLVDIKYDLALHYLRFGSSEGRRPAADFDPHYYTRTYGDKLGDLEPFVHYVTEGRRRRYRGYSSEYLYSEQLVYKNGVVPSLRPRNEDDFALSSPLPEELRSFSFSRVAAIVHGFYPELINEIFDLLEKCPCPIDIFVSTDSQEKAETISTSAASFKNGKVDIRVLENRGRDIGPMLFGFPDVFENYEAFLHLHTKRSPHGGDALEKWRDYLYDNLVGSKEIIATNLTLLDRENTGLVYPQHFYVLRGILNWGFDFDIASKLLKKFNISLSKDMVLEFPSGSMFWARTAALRPLVRLDLKPSDFDPEAGQVDGTLAHAIERSLLYIAESAGFTWAKVLTDFAEYPQPLCVLRVNEREQLNDALARVHRPLASIAMSERYALSRGIPETRPLQFAPSAITRPRFVLFVPSVNPRQAFGGISTAIKIFDDIRKALTNVADFVIIATDAEIESEGYKVFPDFDEQVLGAADRPSRNLLIDANKREGLSFRTRSSDIYFATAWWSAGFAKNGQAFQKDVFGVERKYIYLIQDFEPDFYGWSSNYVLAENTYRNPENFIAIINSEELYRFFQKSDYGIDDAYCLPYRINAKIDKMISPVRREKIIMFYGRPTVRRNAFEILCNGLTIWQTRHPTEASMWKILSVGEDYSEDWTRPVQNVDVLGKLTLEQYAYWLSRASIGISLMISPHPSYPPLEMAEAGLMTITNDYTGKNMAERFDFESLPYLSPELIAEALEKCVDRYQSGDYPVNSGRRLAKKLDHSGIEIYSTENLIERYKSSVDGV